MRAANYICYDDREMICRDCAIELEREGKSVLSATYVINKCRSTLNMMQKEMSQLLKLNQSNINYIC